MAVMRMSEILLEVTRSQEREAVAAERAAAKRADALSAANNGTAPVKVAPEPQEESESQAVRALFDRVLGRTEEVTSREC